MKLWTPVSAERTAGTAAIDALRKSSDTTIRSALEFVCNVYESYNALQRKKRTEIDLRSLFIYRNFPL